LRIGEILTNTGKMIMKRIIYILILITAFASNLELRASDKKIELDSIVIPNHH